MSSKWKECYKCGAKFVPSYEDCPSCKIHQQKVNDNKNSQVKIG